MTDAARWAHDERAARVRSVMVIVIVTISLALAWTDTQLAKFVWLLFLFVPAIGERVSRRLERSPTAWSVKPEGHARISDN